MGEIVFAVGASHAPGLIGYFDDAPKASQDVVRSAYGAIAEEIAQANLDVLIVIANDHLANSRIRAFPDFLVGMAEEHRGPFEWFKPWIGCRDYVVRGDRATAEALFHGLNRRGVRMFATHENLKFDDNISVPTILCELDGEGRPALIPILQNCTVPPLPDQRDSYAVGQALAEVVRDDLPDGLRVGLFGSGGLSHEPGGANYYYIDENFDQGFLALLAEGDHERLLDEMTLERLDAAGGGGTSELLAWFVVLGAISDAPCEVLGYTAYPNWKCGVGAVRWSVPDATTPGRRDAAAAGGVLQDFDPALASHDLVQDLKWDVALRAEFGRDEAAVLDRYPLRPEERLAVEQRNFRALYDLGFHPYLGAQLARLIYGNAAGEEATLAIQKLVSSLRNEG